MEVPTLSVDVMRSPFGVRGIHLMPPSDAATAEAKTCSAANSYASGNYAQVLPQYASPGSTKSRSYSVTGTRGVQQLIANMRRTSHSSTHTPAAAQEKHNDRVSATHPRQHFISEHDMGRLLMWGSETGAVESACSLNPAFTVHHFAIAGPYVYATVEGSAATSGAEEETCVYVWACLDLRKVAVLRGHVGRLTALAVWPNATSTRVATASLDGTLRIWCHKHKPVSQGDGDGGQGSVCLLWMLSTAELGNVQSLTFLSENLVVAAATRCALAFARFPEGRENEGRRGTVRNIDAPDTLSFQALKSNIDADACTTYLHVCPLNHPPASVLAAAPASNASDVSSHATIPMPGSCLADPTSPTTMYLVTGSTSGYIQEWAVDIERASEESPKPPVYVSVKCRWFYKAHCATVNCITTDRDVVVSTSFFDGVCLYHRKAGNVCCITKAAAIPLLVPQRKEIIWGTVDGFLNVSNYAAFACGLESALPLMWSTKPHTTAIRGLCLSLTHDFRWDTLCTGSADGSLCVWRSTAEARRAAADLARSNKNSSPPLITRFLHVLTLTPNRVTEKAITDEEVKSYVVALRPARAGKQGAILVLELTSTGDVGQVADVPFEDNKEVSCAHLCRGENGALSLWVGTPSGQLLHAVKKPGHETWRTLTPVHWDSKPKGSVVAISKAATSSALMVAVVEGVDKKSSTARLFLSQIQLDLNGTAAESMLSLWEKDVVLPESQVTKSGEDTYAMQWASTRGLEEYASPGSVDALIVNRSNGTMVCCLHSGKVPPETSSGLWKSPEIISTGSNGGQSYGVQRNFDESSSSLATVVTVDRSNSDLVCVDISSNSKRVLMPATVWMTKLKTPLLDVGTEKVRLAGVSREGHAASSDVLLFDNDGHECGRVTYEGSIVLRDTPSRMSAPVTLSYTPRVQRMLNNRTSTASQDSEMLTPLLVADCTAMAAHTRERIVFLGYKDGLLQMVDTTDMYVFSRRWATDASGITQPIVEIKYSGFGVVLVRLLDHHLCSFVVPPRSLLDQSPSS